MLIYISALVAIGLSPLVNAIERKRLLRQRVPALGRDSRHLSLHHWRDRRRRHAGRFPPIVTQARELAMELPRLLHQGQQWLIDRGLLTSRDQRAGGGAADGDQLRRQDTMGLVANAVWGFVGGVFGLITMLVLAFYLMVDGERARHGVRPVVPTRETRAGRATRADG